MNHDINLLPTLKDIEKDLFEQLQNYFQAALLHVLEEVDVWLMENRDYQRYEYLERQGCTIESLFGPIPLKRRRYRDREKGERVALLDQYLEFSGGDTLSPFLTELAVEWSVRGPSYRDARDRLKALLGYQVISHEQIRQKVLQIEEKETKAQEEPKAAEVLFLEVDGLNVALQKEEKSSREIKAGIVHEGWEKQHPKSDDYVLINKSYSFTLEDGETFWEQLSRQLYDQYTITKDTYVVINGDGAPWIHKGVDYFPNGLYNYNRFHLKKWIKQALGNRSKAERRHVYQAADSGDPVALVSAVAEAEKAETDEEKKKEISDLRLFILEHFDAFRDYRERLQEKGVDTTGMRQMGAAESNMNLLSRRLKKMGYSWSLKGLGAMMNTMIHRFEGTLKEAVRKTLVSRPPEETSKKHSPSFTTLVTEKTRASVGAIKGHMPALVNDDPRKPYVRALRGLAGM